MTPASGVIGRRSARQQGRTVAVWLALLLGALFLASAAFAQPKFPAIDSRVVDEAGLLSAADRAQLIQELEALEAKSTDQVVVYTTKSLQGYEIEEFANRAFRAWKLGQEGKDNGVLIVVAPSERKVRIEVGRRLEPQLTDLLTKLIIENAILPAFRRGDFPAGVKAGVRDVRDVLLGDAEAVKERARSGKKRQGSGGDDWIPLLFFLLFIALVLLINRSQMRQAQQLPPGARRRRTGDGNVIIIPGGWGGSGHWGGGGGGWSSDSGGFSGGGGDSGGGGASGSW
jgi:uncharacterized protein